MLNIMSVFFPQIIYAVYFIRSLKNSSWVSNYGKYCGNEKQSLQRSGSKGQSIFINTLPNNSILKHFWNILAQPPFQFLRHLRKLFLLLSNHTLSMTKNMFPPAWSPTLFSHQLRLWTAASKYQRVMTYYLIRQSRVGKTTVVEEAFSIKMCEVVASLEQVLYQLIKNIN